MRLCQFLQKYKYNVESNPFKKILLGSHFSTGKNSDTELYEWKIMNYESKTKECCIIELFPKNESDHASL